MKTEWHAIINLFSNSGAIVKYVVWYGLIILDGLILNIILLLLTF